MATTVHLGIFSGRRNPQFVLTNEQEKEFARRFKKLQGSDRRRVSDACPDGFGVFRLTYAHGKRQSHMICGGGIVEFPMHTFTYPDDAGITQFLIDILPVKLVSKDIKSILSTLHSKKLPKRTPPYPTMKKRQCAVNTSADGQPFDSHWGTIPSPTSDGYPWSHHEFCNNCYDYANNQLTDTFAQPGVGSGKKFDLYRCDKIRLSLPGPNTVGNAAVRDGLVKVKNCTNKLSPGQGWYVALLLGKLGDEEDYHWLKQDSSGCWSHKLGGQAPFDNDSNKDQITNPETAVFQYGLLTIAGGVPLYALRYNRFCGYFRTHAAVTIKGEESPSKCPGLDY